MESLSCAISTLAVIFATLTFLSKVLFPKSHKLNLKFPPGPKPWPIIGNLNLIVVIASSPEIAKQILRTHDHVFASRPQAAAGKYTTYNHLNISWAPHGPYWRQGRKIYLSELFNSKRLDSFEYIRVEETCAFLSQLCALSGKPVTLKEHLSRLTLGIISRIVLGKKYFSVSESETSIVALDEFQQMLDELFLLNGVLNIGDWIPWLELLDLQGYVKRMKALKKKFDRFHDHVFGEHRSNKEGVKEFVPKDIVDVLLKLADDPNIEVKLNYDSVRELTQDLIAEGTDTLATTVDWAMSELMKQPHLIEKAIEELDRVIGRER
ncbi:putative flavonoid 3',5'-hydroxylase [Rosa chinensis]|uniref:Putative flavonoid 3',5'-hydroxylase n=1 Tax=Rosa chinensis TaxID=74649 RepID=A0A2P6RKN6_ROSCH|nr:putative flavonoid 3',5'-hydroxylase [Rosa chinensis]